MTAPVYAPSSESYSSVEPLFGDRLPRPLFDGKTPRLAARRSSAYLAGRPVKPDCNACSANLPELGTLWSSLLELLPQGVIVVSRTLQPIYWNSKAQQLCQAQMNVDLTTANLPSAMSDACYRLLRDSHPTVMPLFVKDERFGHTSLRITTRWLSPVTEQQSRSEFHPVAPAPKTGPLQVVSSAEQAYIAIFLEDCDELLQQEMRIQQKKYDLTEREAEICMLLRKECTYQEIARLLQISLNTVKTHVKNIYAKRRSYQGEEKILVL